MDISLNNLKRETNYYIFCKLWANAHFFQAFYKKLKVDKIRYVDTNKRWQAYRSWFLISNMLKGKT